MKKAFKIFSIIILTLLVLQVILFCIGKYGWKLFGFDLCAEPDDLLIETVYVTNESVKITGGVANSATSYVGYTYRIRDNVLYVGIKQNLLLGFTDRIGAYDIEIESNVDDIEAIYLTNSKENKCIWQLDTDKTYGKE